MEKHVLMRGAGMAAALALTLGACGSGSGVPTGASEKEFCEAYNSLFTDALNNVDPEADEDEQAKMIISGLKSWGEKMSEVGTPEDIPDDAREGFELSLQSIEDLDDDANMKDFDALGDDFSEEEKASGEAFDKYATATCPSAVPDTGDITDLPDQE